MNLTNFNKNEEFFVDLQRCIGCKACEMACAECETNGQESLISVNYVERSSTIQTTVQVCMHCEDPVCANVCPADAISPSGSNKHAQTLNSGILEIGSKIPVVS